MMGLCWGATLGSPQLLTNKLGGSRWFTAKNTIHLQKPECNRHASTHVAYEDIDIYIYIIYIHTVIRRYTKKKTKTIRKRRKGRKKRRKRNGEDLPRS
jgi:hypothetical protein